MHGHDSRLGRSGIDTLAGVATSHNRCRTEALRSAAGLLSLRLTGAGGDILGGDAMLTGGDVMLVGGGAMLEGGDAMLVGGGAAMLEGGDAMRGGAMQEGSGATGETPALEVPLGTTLHAAQLTELAFFAVGTRVLGASKVGYI